MGAIQDRTREHLGRSDAAIIRYRLMLRKAIKAVESNKPDALPMANAEAAKIVGPLSNDAVEATSNWHEASVNADMARRAACPWGASV
jgi:hypothetical protein